MKERWNPLKDGLSTHGQFVPALENDDLNFLLKMFTPSHTLRITRYNGVTESIELMHVDGSLYTAAEWYSDTAADWEVDDETRSVTFQGQPAACASYELVAL